MAAISSDASLKSLLPWKRMPCPSAYGGTDLSLSNCSADYFEMSGTSMAAGTVTGAAIRMIGRDPLLTPATVKARLMKSARKIPGDITHVGAGVLDVTAALNATGTAYAAPSPKLIQASDGSGIFVENTAQLWGGAAWSAASIFSDAFVFSDAFIFSDRVAAMSDADLDGDPGDSAIVAPPAGR